MPLAALAQMFTNATTKMVKLEPNQQQSPPAGKHWLIIEGVIRHITGTDSVYITSGVKGDVTIWTLASMMAQGTMVNVVPSATASGYYAFFNTSAAVTTAQNVPLAIITADESCTFTGGTGAFANLKVLEW